MASNLLLLVLSILLLKHLIFTDAQSVGVCYGQNIAYCLQYVGVCSEGNLIQVQNLIQSVVVGCSEQDVVNLYQKNGINRMRMYSPNPAALQALGGTDIELLLDVPNSSLEELTDPNAAAGWVQENILIYPNLKFRYISVGNEVDPDTGSGRFLNYVLPAMKNVQKAINDAGLQIKVSTATYAGLLKTSYPPNEGAFKDNVVGYIAPIIRFLWENNSPMLANIYPYFAYLGNKLDLSYALFTKPDNGEQYKNLFDAIFDAHYAAQSRLGGADVPIVVSESGWPSAGDDGATMENAGIYYKNLIAHVKSGQGTPSRPGISIETYLFEMLDENQKGGKESEKHFGIFFPDRSSKYNLSF